jgi:MFS family permease
MDRLGRRVTSMLLAQSLLIAAIVLQFLATIFNLYELYILGQFVQGFAYSLTPALVLFMAESVPDRFRGMSCLFRCWSIVFYSTGITSLFTNTGAYASITFGALMAYHAVFGNETMWIYYPLVNFIQ